MYNTSIQFYFLKFYSFELRPAFCQQHILAWLRFHPLPVRRGGGGGHSPRNWIGGVPRGRGELENLPRRKLVGTLSNSTKSLKSPRLFCIRSLSYIHVDGLKSKSCCKEKMDRAVGVISATVTPSRKSHARPRQRPRNCHEIATSHSTLRNVSYTCGSYAVVTPLRKAASYEPRIAILGIWGDTWLTRGKYGIYVTVRGNFTGSTWRLLPRKISPIYCRVSYVMYVAVTRIASLVLRNTWHYVIIRYSYGELPKFVLRCSYEAALRKGVTTALRDGLLRESNKHPGINQSKQPVPILCSESHILSSCYLQKWKCPPSLERFTKKLIVYNSQKSALFSS